MQEEVHLELEFGLDTAVGHTQKRTVLWRSDTLSEAPGKLASLVRGSVPADICLGLDTSSGCA